MIQTRQPLNILLVADEPDIIGPLRHQNVHQKPNPLHFHLAYKDKACSVISEQHFDLVIVNQDLELLESLVKVRDESFYKGVPLLLIHDKLDAAGRLKALQIGAVDCVVQPFETMELASKIHRYATSYRNQLHLEKAMILIENDLRAASVIQERLLPPDIYQTYSFLLKYKYLPSSSLAGDLVGYKLVQDALAFYVFDVMGHGVAAAMISTLISIQMNEIYFMLPQKMLDIPFVLKILDTDLQSHISGDDCFYATGVYGVLYKDGTLEYALAGHPEPLWIRKDPGTVEMLPNIDPICPVVGLGMIPKKINPAKIKIQPNDHIFLYTDGILEQTNRMQEEFGIERVKQALLESDLDDPFSNLLQSLQRYAGSESFSDDITLLSVGFTPKPS